MNKYRITKLVCYVGFVVQAIINNFLPIVFVSLQDNYGLDYEKLAALLWLISVHRQLLTC